MCPGCPLSTHVCAPHACSGQWGQKRTLNLWNWTYRWLWTTSKVLKLNLCPLEEQHLLEITLVSFFSSSLPPFLSSLPPSHSSSVRHSLSLQHRLASVSWVLGWSQLYATILDHFYCSTLLGVLWFYGRKYESELHKTLIPLLLLLMSLVGFLKLVFSLHLLIANFLTFRFPFDPIMSLLKVNKLHDQQRLY